jgi:hypothetical protein
MRSIKNLTTAMSETNPSLLITLGINVLASA